MIAKAFDFSGKTAVVVGGSSGIGNGIARAFLAQGAHVIATGTRASTADYSGDEGSDLAGIDYRRLDVTDRTAADRLADGLASVDVVVLCQGAVRYGRAEFEREGWDAVIDVNLNSVMDCARAFQPGLAAQGGSLIIVSSTGAFHAMIGNPAYAASKAGAVALARSLALSWAVDGIRVNAIAPGFVPTKMTTITTQNPKRREATLRRIPLARFGSVEDIAGAALYLASPLSSYVTGQTLIVDGGLTLN